MAPETRRKTAAASSASTPSALRAILIGGLTAGVLDLLFAFTSAGLRGGTPDQVLKLIASGLLGPTARDGGAGTAALGLGMHFAIALGAAVAYVVISRWVPLLVRRPILCGLIFGAAFYAFMNFVAIPLSALPPRTWKATPWSMADLGSHLLLVGLPIALLARRFTIAGGPLASSVPARPPAVAAP